MRSSRIKLFAILGSILFLAGGCNSDRGSAANEFSIYLVKDLTAIEAMSKQLTDLPLETQPVLTDNDIKTYDWPEHEFTMKEGASLEEKLAGKVPSGGRPFVVAVGKERIYLGCFWSYTSSAFFEAIDIPRISSNWLKGSDNGTYKISFRKNQDDPRGDNRVLEALNGLVT